MPDIFYPLISIGLAGMKKTLSQDTYRFILDILILESLPHHDTLKRLLSKIDTSQIENIHLELIKEMIRNKKFRRYLIDKCYPIAIASALELNE